MDENPELAHAIELQQQIKGVLSRIDFLHVEAEKLEEKLEKIKERLSAEERSLLQ